jgi:hypothetical protein
VVRSLNQSRSRTIFLDSLLINLFAGSPVTDTAVAMEELIDISGGDCYC